MGLVLPFMVRAYKKGDVTDLNKIIDRTFSVFMLGVIPLITGTIVVSKPLMALAAGREFAEAGGLLAVLILAAGCVFFGSLFGHVVVALGLPKKTVWIYAVDAAISLALYFAMIPRYGALAAASITIFSELFIAVATFAVVYHKIKFKPSWSPTGKAVLASIPMTGLLLFTPSWPFIPRVLIAGALYVALAILFRAVRRETLLDVMRRSAV